MADALSQRILEHVSGRHYEPRTLKALADDLQVPADQVEQFHAALDELLDDGQVVLGSSDTIALPPPGSRMTGTLRLHERGFGFLVPDMPNEHGDLFIPPGNTLDAMTGDRVRAKVIHQPGRGRSGSDRSPYVGRIVEVLQRADRQYVGTLTRRSRTWAVEMDGRAIHHPVIVRDPGAKNAHEGDKVVLELTEYPEAGSNDWPVGVILEVLGDAGKPDVETLAVMRAYGLPEHFPEPVLQAAREASQSEISNLKSELSDRDGREDFTDLFTCTIDPPDARDFDDAISIRRLAGDAKRPVSDAAYELGVHIADVAHFVTPGSPLDEEAKKRGNSTYLPRKVIPMLPEVLSNGVCSLQEGVDRFVKSCFIQYDAKGNVLHARFARGVIRSNKRLTYIEAQTLIDGEERGAGTKGPRAQGKESSVPGSLDPLIPTLRLMDELAKVIRKRRLKHGMIVLGLPAVELEFDDVGHVIDARPEDDSFTHTLIEMFMVEANEAAARLFDRLHMPMIRRIHPDPTTGDMTALQGFARVAGFNIPTRPSRSELQTLLDAVRGKSAQHAVHLAVLKTLSKAEYSPLLIGHFALASEHYTHFTSPIRRYPDLIVHRGLDAYLDRKNRLAGDAQRPMSSEKGAAARQPLNKKLSRQVPVLYSEPELHEIGRHCSNTEQKSEAAERELRNFLVLELLADHVGDDYEGTVTGVIGNGVFIQLDKFLVDGFVRTNDLPGHAAPEESATKGRVSSDHAKKDHWSLNRNTGALVAQRSGRSINIGHRFVIRIANVELARRQLDLVIVRDLDATGPSKRGPSAKKKPKKKGKSKKKSKTKARTKTKAKPRRRRKS